jgi:hypothetical protein
MSNRMKTPLPAGRHLIRYDFEKTGKEPIGVGGTGRLYVGRSTGGTTRHGSRTP